MRCQKHGYSKKVESHPVVVASSRATIACVREGNHMCFSAEASFAGGAIISAIGVATVTKVHKPSQLIFACIPLFFGLQQITEGCLWLALRYPDVGNLQRFSTYLFLVMAEVIWPILIPLSVLLMEEDRKRSKVLWLLLFMGGALALYLAYCLLFYKVNPRIMGHHIQYSTDFPLSLRTWALLVYLSVTIAPLFVSSIKRTHLLGVLMFLSCAVSVIFFTQFLTSVWCFFAAMISGVIFWILRDSKRKFHLDGLRLLKDNFV